MNFSRPKFEALTAAELKEREISGPLYRLLENYVIPYGCLPGEIRIPAGTETDWASIPALGRFYLNSDDPRILIPSLVHDYLYIVQGDYQPFFRALTRQECDNVLRKLMIECGASPMCAQIVYLAVRAGGGSHWTRSDT